MRIWTPLDIWCEPTLFKLIFSHCFNLISSNIRVVAPCTDEISFSVSFIYFTNQYYELLYTKVGCCVLPF